MGKTPDSIKNIDAVLKYLVDNTWQNKEATNLEIITALKEQRIILPKQTSVILGILEKLRRDGYIHIHNSGHIIKYEGIIHYDTGGYTQVYLDSKKQKNINKWMLIVTISLGISTGIAAIYYIREMFKPEPTNHYNPSPNPSTPGE